MPSHHDNFTNDISDNLGISLTAKNVDSPLLVSINNSIERIEHDCFWFDDSYVHGIPFCDGIRVDIRIFGKDN